MTVLFQTTIFQTESLLWVCVVQQRYGTDAIPPLVCQQPCGCHPHNLESDAKHFYEQYSDIEEFDCETLEELLDLEKCLN